MINKKGDIKEVIAAGSAVVNPFNYVGSNIHDAMYPKYYNAALKLIRVSIYTEHPFSYHAKMRQPYQGQDRPFRIIPYGNMALLIGIDAA